MVLLSAKEVLSSLYVQLENKGREFYDTYRYSPLLAVVLVGNDPASCTYVESKGRVCEKLGFRHRDYHLDESVTEQDLIVLIQQLNKDLEVDGILVQLPLPAHIDEYRVTNTIDPTKDVDGLTSGNLGALLYERSLFTPCTPLGILTLLDYYSIPTAGKDVVIVGRSTIVGKPMQLLLSSKKRDATVTLCHSKTEDLASYTKRADILIVAIGKAHTIDASMVKEGSTLIDVGINRIEDLSRPRGYRVVGDVNFEEVKKKCFAITPVPGGVGPMTIASLMVNTLNAAHHHAKERITT